MSKLGFGFVLMAVLAIAMPGQTFADGHEAAEAATEEAATEAAEDVAAPPADEATEGAADDDADTDSEGADSEEEAQPE